jgi:hypothetical protein
MWEILLLLLLIHPEHDAQDEYLTKWENEHPCGAYYEELTFINNEALFQHDAKTTRLDSLTQEGSEDEPRH